MTKFQKYSLVWFVIYIVVIMTILSSCTDSTHKYAIGYNHGKWSYEDYTDTFQISNGVVKYVDEKGIEIIRYGTFSIEKNKNYKK
jgi:hypothetical protein